MNVYAVGHHDEQQQKEQRDSMTNLLAKVQGDLKQLRQELQSQVDRGDPVNVQSVQDTLSQIETNITDKTEQVIHSRHSKVSTLPIIVNEPLLKKHQKTKSLPVPFVSTSSPGEMVQLQYISKLLSQPTHPATRQVLNDAFGIPYKAETQRRQQTHSQQHRQVISGSTVTRRTTLPLINRRNCTSMSPPPISSKDAQYGLLNLLERGLIPKSTDIVLDPAPVQPKSLEIHKFSKQALKTLPMDNTEGGGAWTGVKFDLRGTSKLLPLPLPLPISTVRDQPTPVIATVTVKTLSASFGNYQQPEETNHRPLPSAQSKIAIRGGCVLEDEQYITFKTENESRWTMFSVLLDSLEEMSQYYDIPVIIIGTKRLIHLAEEYELEPKPKYKQLLSCVINRREVEHLLSIPGRRYKGHHGLQAAAVKVQATCRMYIERCRYLRYRKMKWASGVIAIGWALYMRAQKMKRHIKDTRKSHIANYRTRLQTLAVTWETFHTQRRVIIHLPSKGYPCHIRRDLPQFALSQNFQIPRILEVIDPTVELIYVSPIEIDIEIKEYYQQLLRNVIGDQSVKEMWDRIHFIVPERMDSFGRHQLSLSSFLNYSPMALKQIRNIIGNRPAVLVPHIPSVDDMAIADYLNVPLLGTEPNLLKLYSSFTGRQALFSAAGVTTAPHIRDVFSAEQLVEGLAWLVVNYPSIRRWLFKLNYHCQGRGIAYCDVADHLDCHQWLLKESARYGDKWKKQWAQEKAKQRVLYQLPTILAEHTFTCDTDTFPVWSQYLKEFLSSGGSIEGHPPSDSVTSLTTDLYLKPNQSYMLLSTWDHINSSLFRVWGGSVPQTSVNPKELSDIVDKIAKAALSRGMIGYLSVDYITFIDPDTMSQVIWAVDLDFGPSDMIYMNNLTSIVTGRHLLDWTTGMNTQQSHYIVASTQLRHINLSLIEYAVFFQMCKAHLIGYNNKNSTGTIFTLVETDHKHNLGIICIQPTLKEALMTAAHSLSVIHQEICSSHDLNEVSNFSVVSKVIDDVIEQLEKNNNLETAECSK